MRQQIRRWMNKAKLHGLPGRKKKKKSVKKKKFCKALFTTYLDSLFSIIKRTTFTRVEKHLCSSRLLLSCYQWLLTKQWQFNGIFMNSSSKGSEKQATLLSHLRAFLFLDAICQHVVLRCSLNGGDNCIPLWAHAMMQLLVNCVLVNKKASLPLTLPTIPKLPPCAVHAQACAFALEFTIRVLTWQAWQKSPGSEI